jgi:hypothetical protein
MRDEGRKSPEGCKNRPDLLEPFGPAQHIVPQARPRTESKETGVMSVRIVDVREITKPISSPIRNAYIDFTKMTTSLVAVVTDVVRDGKRVVGYGTRSASRRC